MITAKKVKLLTLLVLSLLGILVSLCGAYISWEKEAFSNPFLSPVIIIVLMIIIYTSSLCLSVAFLGGKKTERFNRDLFFYLGAIAGIIVGVSQAHQYVRSWQGNTLREITAKEWKLRISPESLICPHKLELTNNTGAYLDNFRFGWSNLHLKATLDKENPFPLHIEEYEGALGKRQTIYSDAFSMPHAYSIQSVINLPCGDEEKSVWVSYNGRKITVQRTY